MASEDRFLLGPQIAGDIMKKVKITDKQVLDVELYSKIEITGMSYRSMTKIKVKHPLYTIFTIVTRSGDMETTTKYVVCLKRIGEVPERSIGAGC